MYKAEINGSLSECSVSHRRRDLIALFVFCDGVVDPLLDGQHVVLVAQVAWSLPCDLNASWCREGGQIQSCGRLYTYRHF